MFKEKEIKTEYFESKFRENIKDLKEYEEVKSEKNTLNIGIAGSGKSTSLIKKYYDNIKKNKKCIMIAFTNKACENLRNRLKEEDKNNVHTFNSYLNISENGYDINETKLDKLKNKIILIDEYSMLALQLYKNIIWCIYKIYRFRISFLR